MFSFIKTFFLITWILLWTENMTRAQSLSASERQTLARQIEQSFQQQLLNRWYPLAIDREKGGFLTSFTYDWKPTGNQDKMIVTQARHTWLPAKAAQLYPEMPYLQEAARHGFAFLRDAMWDRTYGGFYTWVTREGKPKNLEDLKTAYGNAFGIYALAAYYQLSGDTTALGLAKRGFQWLEAHSHDPVHKGYFQNLRRDGSPAHLGKSTGAKADLDGELSYKDQNSSIHLLEAFTELYAVWPDSLLRTRLEEMLTLIRDTIVTNKGYLTLFLTPDWQPISYRDSAEAIRKVHEAIDHVSFGHDIETAYLMQEAAHTLELEPDTRTPVIAKKMVDHTLRNGWDANTGGIYDRGYYYRDKNEITILSEDKIWWAEAEAMNTLLLMADQYPNDPLRYGEKFKQQWTYIQQYLIDPTYGGWYEGGLDKEPGRKTGLKAHAWKAAYHDGRTLMNCLQHLRPDTIAPTSATQLSFSRDKKVLQWKAARDNGRVQGYDIYQHGKRIGFTPLPSFRLPEAKLAKGDVFTVVARDGQENKSKPATITY